MALHAQTTEKTSGAIAPVREPDPSIVLVFSRDRSLLALASQVTADNWTVERCDDVRRCRESLARPNLKLVVVDDEAIEDQLRGWLLDRVRSWAPQVPFIYIAGAHTDESERRARAYLTSYYTSKPVETESLRRVLGWFIRRTLNQANRN